MIRPISVALGFSVLLLAATAGAAQLSPLGLPRLPNGGRPATRIPFPAVVDRNTIRITLDRGACFGPCPIYHVEISGDGTVSYVGRASVAVTGKHEDHIPVETVLSLYDAFMKADFFWTLDSYRAPISDLATYTVSISFDGHRKQVIDYAGTLIGMPKEIAELETSIDSVAGTGKWVKGN